MQLQFRIDDNNYLTYELHISSTGLGPDGNSPEVSAVTVNAQATKLSNISDNQLLDVVDQVLGHLTAPDSGPETHTPVDDWHEQFRKG